MAESPFLAGLHATFAVAPELVVGLVERATGRDVVDARRVARGYDNEVHRVELADGSAVYARIARPGKDEFANEAWAMSQAASVGVPVPTVLLQDTVDERSAMVITAAPGRQLEAVLASLGPADRRSAMAKVGRLLATLHSVRVAGIWRPDAQGAWPDRAELRRDWLADRKAERPYLEAAGLSAEEIEQTLALLGASPDTPAQDDPVLCHGDVAPEHLFVDSDLNVSCLIDWGMWHGGTAIGELALASTTHEEADFTAMLGGYGGEARTPAFRLAIALSAVNQLVGHIAHHVSIGDDQGTARTVAQHRRALTEISRAGAGTRSAPPRRGR